MLLMQLNTDGWQQWQMVVASWKEVKRKLVFEKSGAGFGGKEVIQLVRKSL